MSDYNHRETKEEETQQEEEPKQEDTASAPDEQEEMSRTDRKKKKRIHPFWRPTRLLPIWLRIVLVLALIAAAALAGAVVGYAILGEGGSPSDVLEPETWYHIYDIIYDNTERGRD
ncbi:DNA-directed RNA polymerase subunit beta [Alkalicoccus chagannorensis]|uniref:DNA-directed RNA polymerase subunit beta n=1 Tax=Alkalicoccus chagannorensis TaxID=427072 RepID=UPI000423D121|nr:DNA-directed RNA polymerase subunit beta [Alkalicoccus chagannorensis]